MSAETLDERLKRASQSYYEKGSCTQAVLDAFMDENARLPARCPSDLCGVLRAAETILRRSSQASDMALEQIVACFRTEYGGITCQEMLQSIDPNSHCCRMKVKDTVLLVHRALEQTEGEGL